MTSIERDQYFVKVKQQSSHFSTANFFLGLATTLSFNLHASRRKTHPEKAVNSRLKKNSSSCLFFTL